VARRLFPLVPAAICGLALAASGPAAAAKTPLPAFNSPSGNIKCLLLPAPGTGVLCSIGRADYAKTLQDRCLNPKGAKGAGVDWHGFLLPASGKGEVNCSGGILYNPDKQRPAYVTLAYGKSWHRGGLTCLSRVSGVTCRNGHGHGIFVSRGSWRAW
jgi:hypothetical protein